MRLLLALASFLAAAAFGAVGAVTLITGKAPRKNPELFDDDLRVGVTSSVIGLVAAGVGWALLRARAAARARGSEGGGTGAWKPIAAAGVGLAVLAARFGDDVARHADDLDLARAARGVDASFGAPPLGSRASTEGDFFEAVPTEADFFESAMEAASLALDANDLRELLALTQEGAGADVVIAMRIAATETVERYRPLGQDRYELVEQRHVRRSSTAHDGVVVADESKLDDEPLDAAAGESVIVVLGRGEKGADGKERAAISFECRRLLGVGGPVESFTLPSEVELVDVSLGAAPDDFRVTMRTTPAGRQRAAEALRAAMDTTLARELQASALGVTDLDLEVRVPRFAESTLVLTRAALELTAPDETVIEVIAKGWR